MLIIVEGPDGSGKTTLVNRILERLAAEDAPTWPFHASPPRRHPLDEYVTSLLDYTPGRSHVVCDRWHIGEHVYPYVYHRATQMDMAVWRYIEMFLRSRGAVVVRMLTSTPTLIQRIRERGDDAIPTDQVDELVPRIQAGFAAAFANTALPVVRMHTWDDDAITRLIDYAREKEDHAVRLTRPFITYVGPLSPSYVLVGDVRKRPEPKNAPAFMPYPATSGHFLLTNLRGPRVPLVGLINANDVDDLAKFFDTHMTRAVTLGRNASRGVRSEGQVPHPQFIRRFYHSAGEAYGRVIDWALVGGGDYRKWRP